MNLLTFQLSSIQVDYLLYLLWAFAVFIVLDWMMPKPHTPMVVKAVGAFGYVTPIFLCKSMLTGIPLGVILAFILEYFAWSFITNKSNEDKDKDPPIGKPRFQN